MIDLPAIRPTLHLLLLLPLLCCNTAVAQTSSRPQVLSLLSQMSQALRQTDYRGLFTYEVGDSLQTYKIVHQIRDGVEHERLQKLDGASHEVLRSGQQVDCLSPGHRLLRRLLEGVDGSLDNQQHYQFRLAGEARIAGRQAQVVEIIPSDSYRYGYVLALDTHSGLPLQMLLVDQQSRILERIQFVELEVGTASGDWDLAPRDADFLRADHELLACDKVASAEAPRDWQLNWLPAGFEYTGQRRTENGDLMLIYTDGLASFSVFIGPARWPQALQGRAQRGGTVAYVRQEQAAGADDGHSVTVVGEIPMATAQQLVEGLAPRP